MKKFVIAIVLLISGSLLGSSTTWFPAKHRCPICHEQNEYMEIGSYGSYIYNYPSKYQYIFWPLTDFPTVYYCLDCGYSAYMWDFDSVPDQKIDTIQNYLITIEFDRKYKSYTDIPVSTRLEISEGIYKILGRDAKFWSQFYRVKGYHYESENKRDEAIIARKRALEITQGILCDTIYIGQEKEFLLIIAAMHNFLNDPDSAMFYLAEASYLTYTDTELDEEYSNNIDNYLTELIADYQEYICNPNKGKINER